MNNPILEQETDFTLPLTARLVNTVIQSFCMKPVQGDDSWEYCSVGVAKNSLVATDSRSAIMIGEAATSHYATKRKEAMIECERSKQYGDPVRALEIEPNVDDDNKPKPMPDVNGVISQALGKMRSVAVVDPSALLAIAKVAEAAGAVSLEIFQPSDNKVQALGFRFKFAPHESHTNLFSTWEGDIQASGVFLARAAEKSEEAEAELPAVEPETPKTKPAKKSEPAVELSVVTNDNPELTVEPVAPFDLHVERTASGYNLPTLSILAAPIPDEGQSNEYGKQIIDVLRGFNITGRLAGFLRGPAITQYQIEIPPNIKTNKVTATEKNIAMSLAVSSIRIEAPIPGKNAVGIEVPNKVRSTVALQELVASNEFFDGPALNVALGKDVSGRPVLGDLTKMPHLLIAGATGSGKSIGLATLICSLLLRNSPKDLRFVMIDPKRVELALFDGIPHLMCPVIKDTKEAPGVLRAVWREMDRRYDMLSSKGVRNIEGWNGKVDEGEKLPYIVVVIDELADLMMTAGPEVETSIVRLAQMARAVGIHLVIATQRPSVDVITGLIKANVPSRIAYAVASQVDSRVILDGNGAEMLLGAGDALYNPIGAMKPLRIQGGYVSEEEVETICNHWRNQSKPNYELVVEVSADGFDGDDKDSLLLESALLAVEKGQLSTSMIQRKFSIGFQRASRILETLESWSVISERDGPRPRQVKVTKEQLDMILEEKGLG